MLTIGIIDSFCRIRDVKEMSAILNVNNDTRFVFIATTNRTDSIKLMNRYDNFKYYYVPGCKAITVRSICRKEKVDVLHTHNSPDVYGKIAIQLRDNRGLGVPVVHEVHDCAYDIVTQSSLADEKFVMNNADHIICVSEGMLDYLDKYNIRDRATVIYSYPNSIYLPKQIKKYNRLHNCGVYQGGISRAHLKSKFGHRNYLTVFQKLVKNNVSIDIYPPAKSYNKMTYNIHNVNFKHFIPDIRVLYKMISTYDFGFVGYKRTGSKILDIAMPNKLFEYIGCGIPVVAMDYVQIAKFVRKHNVGIVVNDDIKLPTDFNKRIAVARSNVLKLRDRFTMETQVDKLLNIYKKVVR